MPKFLLSDREINDLAGYLLSLKGVAATSTKGTIGTGGTAYALLPHVDAARSCLVCGEAEERKAQI
jgi:hypothetical protein